MANRLRLRRSWTTAGLWEQLNAVLVQLARTRQGRQPEASAAVLGGHGVKTSEGGEARGMDVYKQTNGRKRHIVADTLGLLLMVVVHSASVQDAAGGQVVCSGCLSGSRSVCITAGAGSS